jgi:hypothetical protein
MLRRPLAMRERVLERYKDLLNEVIPVKGKTPSSTHDCDMNAIVS